MDFDNLNADVTRILNKHYTKGRDGHKIKYVVIHYNGGNLTVDGCYNVWQTRKASAHYQVQSDGVIGQLVWDSNTAWHAGNWVANCESIGIEHANIGNAITADCINSGAHLTAAVCRYYGLGRPEWGVNVFPHQHFSATDCPGPLRDGTYYNTQYMALAQAYYDGDEIMTDADKQDVINGVMTALKNYTYDPTGRGMNVNIFEHVKWIAASLNELRADVNTLIAKVGK